MVNWEGLNPFKIAEISVAVLAFPFIFAGALIKQAGETLVNNCPLNENNDPRGIRKETYPPAAVII